MMNTFSTGWDFPILRHVINKTNEIIDIQYKFERDMSDLMVVTILVLDLAQLDAWASVSA